MDTGRILAELDAIYEAIDSDPGEARRMLSDLGERLRTPVSQVGKPQTVRKSPDQKYMDKEKRKAEQRKTYQSAFRNADEVIAELRRQRNTPIPDGVPKPPWIE